MLAISFGYETVVSWCGSRLFDDVAWIDDGSARRQHGHRRLRDTPDGNAGRRRGLQRGGHQEPQGHRLFHRGHHGPQPGRCGRGRRQGAPASRQEQTYW